MTNTVPDSFWNATARRPAYPALAGAAQADVAVIGGGIVGLTLADLLKRAGRTVAVIEAQRLGAQTSGRSTAKLTALHGLTYTNLIDRYGVDTARLYAQANQAALAYVAERVAQDNIDCALTPATAYTYSASGESQGAVRREAEAAQRAGLAVDYVDEVPLPFAIAGAVRLAQQYQFHPARYLAGLAARLDGDGSHVFEQTRAVAVEEGKPCRVLTEVGTVSAAQVVLATHLPFLDRGMFFAKAFPRHHVALAARLPGDRPAPQGMFYCADSDGVSVRVFDDAAGAVLIATDRGERPGHSEVTQRYRLLENQVRERYGATEILNRWSNEDYVSVDGLPFVGRMPGMEHVLLATGFSGWGLSNGTAAAQLLADLLLGRRNELASSWRAGRWNLRRNGRTLIAVNLHAAREMIGDRLAGLRAPPASDLAHGEGGLIRHHGRLAAAFRDASGELRCFSPYCTHLRCVLAWNGADQVWECPCHGSRFDSEGQVIHGPARRNLRRLE